MLVAAMTVIGACGYILIEHWGVLDAFYMSVITISTVGFGEVRPLSPAGRLFTIGLIVTGVGSAIYLFSVIGELVVEGRLKEFLGKSAMNRKIHGLEGHVIVCGFGRFGKCRNFRECRYDDRERPIVGFDDDCVTEIGHPYGFVAAGAVPARTGATCGLRSRFV